MQTNIVPLSYEHLDELGVTMTSLRQAYFSPGSVAYFLLDGHRPVLVGGIVNMMWHRGEIWMLPSYWLTKHVRECSRILRDMVPKMAKEGHFNRVQATCPVISNHNGIWQSCNNSVRLFLHLGFSYEGTMEKFGINGETCYMYARLF